MQAAFDLTVVILLGAESRHDEEPDASAPDVQVFLGNAVLWYEADNLACAQSKGSWPQVGPHKPAGRPSDEPDVTAAWCE